MGVDLEVQLSWPLFAHQCDDFGGCVQCGHCYVGIGAWNTGLGGSTFTLAGLADSIANHATVCNSPNASVTPTRPIRTLRAVKPLEDPHD